MKHNWTYKKLGELVNIHDTLRKPVTKKDRKAGVYPYYGATGIQDYVDNYIFDGRYVLVGEDGAKWGANEKSAYIIEGKSWVNNHAHVLSFTSDVCDSFVAYYLNYKDLDSFISGAIVRKLTQKSLLSIPLPCPSLDEQQAVVRELDGINRLIDLQEEQLREYDRMAQSLFYTTFGDPATNPKGWEVKKLGDYFHIGSSKRVFQSEWKSKGVPFYRAREVVKLAKDGFVDNELFIDEELYTEYASKYGIPVAGDILVTGVGTLGITYIVKENDRFYYKDGNIICLHKNTDIESLFIDFLFKTPYLRSQIENCSGATVGTYTIDRAKKTEIIVPPLSLQQSFAVQIEAIEQQKALIRRSLDETRTLLAARMQYYFE